MLKDDLTAAKVKYETDDGVADFHVLRHTFGTLLAQSGVLPQEVQRLMRHSDINLTMGIYTHLRIHDKARAIDKLPVLTEKAKQVKTGTDDSTG
jgi:integrase